MLCLPSRGIEDHHNIRRGSEARGSNSTSLRQNWSFSSTGSWTPKMLLTYLNWFNNHSGLIQLINWKGLIEKKNQSWEQLLKTALRMQPWLEQDIHDPCKGLIFRIYTELLQTNNKRNSPSEKIGMRTEQASHKRENPNGWQTENLLQHLYLIQLEFTLVAMIDTMLIWKKLWVQMKKLWNCFFQV